MTSANDKLETRTGSDKVERKPIGTRASVEEIRLIDLAAVHTGKRRDRFMREAALAEAARVLASLDPAA